MCRHIMVFYLRAKCGTLLYVGKDKEENESLIAHGWPEDVWFHVDNVSSPHVYARLAPGQSIDDLTPDAVRDAAQWVKAQSIEGCKLATATVLYTPWANLRKDGSMATGQVSFHAPAAVRRYAVLERDKETLRRLEKGREERFPDLAAERRARDEEERARTKAAAREKAKADKEAAEAARRDKEARSYDTLVGKKTAGAGAGAGAAAPAKGGKKGKLGAGRVDRVDDVGDLGMGGLGLAPTEDATAAKNFEVRRRSRGDGALRVWLEPTLDTPCHPSRSQEGFM